MKVTSGTTGNTLQVPLNATKFRQYRNMNVALAGIALFMVALALCGGIYMVDSAFTVVKSRGFGIFGAFLSLWLVVFIGLAAVPAWQLSSLQYKILKRKAPAMIVDQNGIQDNASNYVFEFIPWSEIESVILTSRYAPNIKKTFSGVAVVLKDKKMLLRKKSKLFAMWMMPDDEIMKKRQVFIPQGRIDMPVEEVVEQINIFRARMGV